MGDQCYMLKDGEEVPVEPSGTLLATGWLPGTWVTYATTAPTFNPQVIAAVERSDGTGILAGFLIYGPQHKLALEVESDMWNIGTRQKAGGDDYFNWHAIDAGTAWQFDSQKQLQRVGSRICTMYLPPSGFFKFYVFETQDKALRSGGAGSTLTYTPGDKLYVSENGLLTSEKETASHIWTGYVVARYDTDEEGTYIICCAAMG
jgi:hypothetical protein